MIKLSQQAIVELFVEKLLRLGCKKITRTVNPADPTETTTIKGEIGMQYGLDANWPGPYRHAPDPQIIDVRIVETPYGTDISFAPVRSDTWSSGYLDDDNKWHLVAGERFFADLKRLINESVSAKIIKAQLVLSDCDEGDFEHDHLANHE